MQAVDPYIWMENLDDPRVKKFIEEENKRLREFLGDLPSKLYPRIAKYYMMNYPTMIRVTDRGYFALFKEGKVLKIKFRPREGEGWIELVNSEQLGKDYIIRYFYVNQDGTRLAYEFSYGGADVGATRIIDVDSLETVDEIKGDIHGVLWLDKDRIYYVRFFRSEKTPDGIPPPASRVFLREEEKEEMVFGQGLPPMYFIGLDRSRFSDHVLAIVSYGWTESMAYGGPLRDPNKWEKIYEGHGYIVYPVEYVNNRYLITSFEKNMGCILSVRNGEKEILIDEWEFPLQSAVVVEDRILVHYLQHASSILKIFNFRGELLDKVISDVPGTISSLDSNGMEAVFLFQSFWIPYRIYRFGLDKMELLESNEVSNDYIVEEDFTTSKDGTKIHLFIVRKRNSPIRNVLLFGYGGFRISITPSFVPSVLPFIDDGGAYAIANIRGGLEYGEEWHRQGMRENKQNVFDDFMAAIEYFRKKGARVVATGRSNGGLLVGAVLTQRPELLDGALIGYPVLDMLRFHKLYIGRAWVPEYGDPDNPKDAEFLRKYSPYHNISKEKKYPPTLVYTGLHDDRVHPAHALKFVARLKEVGAPVYLRVETVSGHAGASPEIRLKEYSDTLAFVYKVLNMTTSEDSSS